jgi:hypothetical protein
MSPIAGRMEGRCSLGDVLVNNRHVADMAIAEAKLVVGEPDGARIVGALRLLERLGEEGYTAGRLSACDRKATVHSPQIREPGGAQALSAHRRRTKRFGRLTHIVLKKPSLGQRAPDLDLLVTMEAGLAQGSDEKGRGFHAGSSFKRPGRLRVKIGRRHGAQYSRYTGNGG